MNIGYHAIPIIVVGLLAPVIFLIWSCCRCCRCTQCCSAPEQVSGSGKFIMTILLLALGVTAAVMIFYGFAAATQQTQAFADVDTLLTDIEGWVNDVGTRGTNVNTAGNDVVNQITTLINDDTNTCYDHTALTALSSQISGPFSSRPRHTSLTLTTPRIADVTSAVSGITSLASGNSFDSIQTQVINQRTLFYLTPLRSLTLTHTSHQSTRSAASASSRC